LYDSLIQDYSLNFTFANNHFGGLLFRGIKKSFNQANHACPPKEGFRQSPVGAACFCLLVIPAQAGIQTKSSLEEMI
jgi:hypothetical protein